MAFVPPAGSCTLYPKDPAMAKHATMADYRRATGFEALIGYLYLKEEYTRMITLIRMGIGEEIL